MFEVFLMSFCLLSDQLRHKMAFFVIFFLFCGTPSPEGDHLIQVSLYINTPISKTLQVKNRKK